MCLLVRPDFITLVLISTYIEDIEPSKVSNIKRERDRGPIFAGPIPNVTVALGREANIPCVVNELGSYRAAWIRVETKAILTIHQHVITRNYRISLSHSDNRNFILQVKDVKESDRGGYMCQLNTVPMMSQVGYLDVLVPPDIIVDQSTSDIVTREGTNVTLSCTAKGYPEPNITWRREDDEPIPLILGIGKKLMNTSYEGEDLNISRVTRVHMGAYLCIASNGVPPSVSRRVLLHVQFPPVLWVPNQLVGAHAGEEIALDCHSEAYPVSINFWKKRGGQMILSNEKFDVSSKAKSYKVHMRLSIRKLQPEDFGTYSCFAKNSLGSTEGTIRLYEIPTSTSFSRDAAEKFKHTNRDFPKHQSLGSSKSSRKFNVENGLPSMEATTRNSSETRTVINVLATMLLCIANLFTRAII
ncbi:lachesin-like isoform X2 [Tachypleus tridentatus]|uniref:lachesin-like isoform X2 n=1 Tax=Tachypleus tridentatus TaxID=6853 RepID=UPI003FD2F902